jgi:hypothetical protein
MADLEVISVAVSVATVVAAFAAVVTATLTSFWSSKQWRTTQLERDASLLIDLYKEFLKRNERVAEASVEIIKIVNSKEDISKDEIKLSLQIRKILQRIDEIHDDVRFGSIAQKLASARVSHFEALSKGSRVNDSGFSEHLQLVKGIMEHFDSISDRRNSLLESLVRTHDDLVDDLNKLTKSEFTKLGNDPTVKSNLGLVQ